MEKIETLEELEALYGTPSHRSIVKVQPALTPLYTQWIEASRFCVVSTVGPEGTDGSPRGDDGPVVKIADARTLWLPDWMGNNRGDTLRNVLRDGRISLMFMATGSTTVVRVNGTAVLTADPTVTGAFDQSGRTPRSVIVITTQEIYFQCAKALMRADIWAQPHVSGLPTAGQFLREAEADFDAETYDAGYAEYAKPRMW